MGHIVGDRHAAGGRGLRAGWWQRTERQRRGAGGARRLRFCQGHGRRRWWWWWWRRRRSATGRAVLARQRRHADTGVPAGAGAGLRRFSIRPGAYDQRGQRIAQFQAHALGGTDPAAWQQTWQYDDAGRLAQRLEYFASAAARMRCFSAALNWRRPCVRGARTSTDETVSGGLARNGFGMSISNQSRPKMRNNFTASLSQRL